MGGNSTLQSTVSSDSVGAQEKFDLKSWQGLTELLKAGKNALKPEAYAEFRNLVLQYAQHGGDVAYKKRIDDMVATFGRPAIEPVEVVTTEKETAQKVVPVPVQNSRRIAPRFGDVAPAGKPISSEVVDSTKESEPSTIVPDVAPEPEQISAPVSVPDIPKTPEPVSKPVVEESVPPTPEPVPEPIPVMPPPVPEPISEPEISIPTPIPEPIPTPAPREVPLPPSPVVQSEPELLPQEQMPFMSLEQCKVRIAEIKRAVNTHFGNPVALMAVPNNLGKVYMTALLGALKAATPGASGNVGGAMAELERAFKVLMEGDMAAPIVSAPKIPESVPVPELTPEKKPTPEVPPAPKPETLSETPVIVPVPTPIPEPIPAPEIEIQKVSEPAPSPEVSPKVDVERMSIIERIESEQGLPSLEDAEKSEVSRTEEMHSAFAKTDNAISAVVGSVHKKLPPISGSIAELVEDEVSGYDTWQGTAGPTTSTRTEVVPADDLIHRENKYTKKGIVDTAHPEELQEQGIDTADITVKQSELVSPQITTMLNKLLHEWSIFGGSGFFGIGPGGTEHPLFKKLAVMSMGEVVAGRFDGADPKAVKIIKQYVDAWRHEQGITYTPNETFEHYLRRVVQRIIKRQST